MKKIFLIVFVFTTYVAKSQTNDAQKTLILSALNSFNVKEINKFYFWSKKADEFENKDTIVTLKIKNAFSFPFKHHILLETTKNSSESIDAGIVKITIFINASEINKVKFYNSELNNSFLDKMKTNFCSNVSLTNSDIIKINLTFLENHFGESVRFQYYKMNDKKRILNNCESDDIEKKELIDLLKIQFSDL